MAIATTRPFSGLVVMVEDPDDVGTYIAPCGFTSRALVLSKEPNETNIPDCDDEDAASWVGRDIVTKSATISGDGVLAQESFPTWRALFETDTSFNARVLVSGNLAAGGGHWAGAFHLTSFEVGAERGQKVTAGIEMVSDGAVTWVPAAA